LAGLLLARLDHYSSKINNMATYGRGQMLGSGINPESFKQDFSGFARAAEIQAQGMANIGERIGSAIKDFGEAKEQRKKIDAETKASRAGIESAIKLGDALGFDVKGMLSPVLDRMDDPNTTPIEAAALGREASTQIANVLNLGFKAKDQEYQRASLTQDAAYKNEQLRIAQQNANSRAQAAIAAGGNAPPLVDVPLGDGSTQKMQWDRESQSYTPISVSGLSGVSTSSLGNLPDALKPYAEDFETAGAKYGVAPNILAAISMHETANGTSSAFRNKNNAMGISDASGPVEVGSVAESIDKMARLLGRGINEGTGPYANAKSIEDIANIYAPPGAGNDPRNLNQFWTQGVTSNIQKLSENKAEQIEPTTQNQGRIGFTPAEAKESTFRPATKEELSAYGAVGGQIDESTKRFYPITPPQATVTEELKLKAANEKQLNAYAAGQSMLDILDQVYDPKTGKVHPGFSGSVGAKGISSLFGLKQKPVGGTDAADAVALIDQIAGKTFLSGFEALKGGGAISNTEGEKAQAAAGRTSRDQTEEGFKKGLDEIRETILKSMRRLEELGINTSDGSQSAPMQQNQQVETPSDRPIDILKGKLSK
jgi:hypothetical protein